MQYALGPRLVLPGCAGSRFGTDFLVDNRHPTPQPRSRKSEAGAQPALPIAMRNIPLKSPAREAAP
jgi:hypothetical protein